jgi:hypothetical protein
MNYDQWIVHHRFDPARPFFRVSLGDRAGTVLYVSARSGDVLQRTRKSERFWNFPGAVAHWIYPQVIRRDWALWDRLVWWLSLVGVLVASTGLVLGLIRLRNQRSKAGIARFTPFRGWWRWHHALGISGGTFLLTWIVSGWLSMDHGRLFPTGEMAPERLESYYGTSLESAIQEIEVEQLAGMQTGWRELVFERFAGGPLLLARSPDRQQVWARVRPDRSTIEAELMRAWPESQVQAAEAIEQDDAYAHLLEGPLPESALRFVVDDRAGTWVHVDGETGVILNVMDRSRRRYRWLYNGLHSFDVPFLAQRQNLRRGLILLLLAIGSALSVTSVALALGRLRRQKQAIGELRE